MIERPPMGQDFKVADIPDLPGTKIGDFAVELVFRSNGRIYVVMVCPTCGKPRVTTLANANRAVGRCKHN